MVFWFKAASMLAIADCGAAAVKNDQCAPKEPLMQVGCGIRLDAPLLVATAKGCDRPSMFRV